jgi:hypothetical protein
LIAFREGAGPQCVITNLAYLNFDKKTKRMKLQNIHPGVSIEQVKDSTGFDLMIDKNLKETNPPTVEEIKLLREKVDPLSIRKLEVLAGEEREKLLNGIIQKELEMENRFPKLLSH